MTLYCPNCSAPLKKDAPAECWNCEALFDGDSEWRPTAAPVGVFRERERPKPVQPGAATQIPVARIFGCLVAVVLTLVALVCVDMMKLLARMDPPVEYLLKMDAPPQEQLYTWSGWERGGGPVSAHPHLPVAAIEAHRIARRQTLFNDYMFCQARYLMKDGTTRVTYAGCPVQHATLRPYRAEMLAAVIGLAGFGLLALSLWPKKK